MKAKRLYSILSVLLLFVANIKAQEGNILYIPELDVEPGKDFLLPICVQNTSSKITAIQFDIELPDELTVDFSKAKTTERVSSHKVRYQQKSERTWTVMIYSSNNSTISNSTGNVYEIPAIVNKDTEEGRILEMQFNRVVLSDSLGANVLTDYSCGNIHVVRIPDFVVKDVKSSLTTINPEDELSITWKVLNIGSAASKGGWSERVSLISRNGDSLTLGSLKYDDVLNVGDEIDRSLDVKLGRILGVDGYGKISVELVPDEDSGESLPNQDNNTTESDNKSIIINKRLYVTFPSEVYEPKNDSILVLNIIRSGSKKSDQQIVLSTSGDKCLILPENTIIPANSSEASFDVTLKGKDNSVIRESATTHLSVYISGYSTIRKTVEIICNNGPNLRVKDVKCSDPIAGSTFTVTWKVANVGNMSTEDASWKEYVWLLPSVSDGTSASGSKLLGSVDNITALAIGESYENTITVTLPERYYGNYDLVVMADMYNLNKIDLSKNNGEVPYPYEPETADYGYLQATTNSSYRSLKESGDKKGMSNNFFYKQIEIMVPPLADLITSNVVAVVDNSETFPSPISMAGLASSSAFYSGKKVNVSATVKNQGGKDVKGINVTSALYICTTNDLSTGVWKQIGKSSKKMTLLQDESTNVTISGSIPYEWYGDTYFIVRVDVDDAVYELANKENNKCASRLINTLLTPGADFVPYDIQVPSRIVSGGKMDVKYKVKNEGPGIPYTSPWKDKIYLSKSGNGLDNTAIELGTFSHGGSYVGKTIFSGGGAGSIITDPSNYTFQGDNYQASHNVDVKILSPGTYYVYVKVDAENKVFEYDGEENNVIMSKPITLCVPDLAAELVSVSDETLYTGNTVAFTWKLKNVGTADITNVVVKDAFYASRILLGEVTNTISIAAGGEKTLRTNITIPVESGLSGQKAICVKTNTDRSVPENNYDNNTSETITKTFEKIDDIKVIGKNITITNVQTVSEAISGSQIEVSYNVKNTGTETIDKNVKHEVWLSKKSPFDTNCSYLCPIKAAPASIVGLQSTESVSTHLTVTVPNNIIGGDYHLFVVVNRNNQLVEKLKWDNTVQLSIKLNGNLPDLSITDITFPTEVNTMEPTDLTLKVNNTGDWEADASSCDIFLSADDKYDKYDKKIDVMGVDKIKKGGSVTLKKNIQIEDGLIGDQYLILKISNNFQEHSKDNNVSSKAFASIQSPLPDLSVSELSTEGRLKSGQAVTLSVKVTNMGDHATKKDSWTDCFYLSSSKELDGKKAKKLGSKTHNGILKAGESYTASVEVNLPDDMSGDYWLFAKTDATNVIYESNEDNDTISTPVYIQNAYDTPAELYISDISAPVQVKAGELVSLNYTVKNEGAFDADGILRDVIYLSKDNEWDENDEMVGVVSGTVTIRPGEQLERNVTGRITNITEGDYHFIIRTNSAHTIIETNYDDNILGQNAVTTVDFEELNIGNISSLNTSGYFKLDIPFGYEGKTIGVYLSHPETSTAGLYSAYEKVPTTASFDRHSNVLETTEQEVLIPNVQAGTYYVLAQDNASMKKNLNVFSLTGEQSPTAIPMTITARVVPFGASTLSIKEGGNGGWITTEIHGALLDSIMDFRLASDKKIIPAESITFKDQTATITTFNLNDVETGSYDVVSELPNGTQATLPDGFHVIPGISVKLGVKLNAPGRVFSGDYAPISIAFANGGNTDIAIKELLVVIEGGYLSTTIEGLKDKVTELHFVPDIEQDKRGFVSIPPAKQEVFNCYMKQITTNNSHIVVYVVQ